MYFNWNLEVCERICYFSGNEIDEPIEVAAPDRPLATMRPHSKMDISPIPPLTCNLALTNDVRILFIYRLSSTATSMKQGFTI